MRDIARVMEMEAASLYNHVPSKQSILTDLLMSIADQFTEGMNDILRSDLSALKMMESIIDQHIDLTVSHTDSIALIPNEWIHLEEPHLKRFATLRKNYEKEFKSIIKQCMKDGSMKQANVDVVVFSILSTLRWLYSWYSRRKIKVPELKKEMKKALLEGIT